MMSKSFEARAAKAAWDLPESQVSQVEKPDGLGILVGKIIGKSNICSAKTGLLPAKVSVLPTALCENDIDFHPAGPVFPKEINSRLVGLVEGKVGGTPKGFMNCFP